MVAFRVIHEPEVKARLRQYEGQYDVSSQVFFDTVRYVGMTLRQSWAESNDDPLANIPINVAMDWTTWCRIAEVSGILL